MQNLISALKPKWAFSTLWFFVFGLFLPTQLGRHFWPDFAFVNGIRSDYLAPTIYLTDLLLLALPFVIKWRWGKIRLTFVTLSLILIVGFNFWLTQEKLLWLYRLFQYLKIAIIAFLFWQASVKERRGFLWGSMMGALYSLGLVLLQLSNQGSLQGGWYFLGERAFTLQTPGIATVSFNGQRLLRAYGSFSHPNTLSGFYLALSVILVANKRFWPLILTIPLVLLSFSKLAILLVALLLLGSLIGQKSTCRLCTLGKLLLSAWLGGLVFLYQGNPHSLSERLHTWTSSVWFIIKHPQGVGLGNYLLPGFNLTPQPVHNLWLILTLELGILIWPHLYLLLKAVLQRLKTQPQWRGAVLILMTACFDHYWLTQVQTQAMLGVLLGFILSPLSNRKTESSV
jgi:hypothetical protein